MGLGKILDDTHKEMVLKAYESDKQLVGLIVKAGWGAEFVDEIQTYLENNFYVFHDKSGLRR